MGRGLEKTLYGVVLWLIVQLFAAGWWCGGVSNRITNIESTMVKGAEISERLARVETQLQNLIKQIGALNVELCDLRKARK